MATIEAPNAASTLHLRGVGKQIAKHLERLNIHSIPDLLFHFPLRYQDRTKIEMIRGLKPGMEAVVEGVIKQMTKPTRGRTKLLCELHDGTGTLYLRFFHILSFQHDVLKVGNRLRCYSETRLGPKGLEMTHPEFQLIKEGQDLPVSNHLTPIYPGTEGLSQYMLRKLTTNALSWMADDTRFRELLPDSLLQAHQFLTLKEAVHFIHRPPCDADIAQLIEGRTAAQKRLVFEELLAHRMSLLQVKKLFQSQTSMPLINETLTEQFLQSLPFQLTKAQERVLQEIKADLKRAEPMLRLVQGDVGSGKTVIAALAMLQAVENGYQAALMAPTELLAEQHYRVFKKWLAPFNINVVYLAGNVKGKLRTEVLGEINNGNAQIILGTHALFQDNVQFFKLGLIVVDEQHRFGVHQRALFREKGVQNQYFPHQLIMTATPIPRTLAMSFYADLDCSTIDELPPGRTPVITSVIPNSRREEVIARIHAASGEGRQTYWVCPLIEESEAIACEAATVTATALQNALPNLAVGLIHGRMSSDDKESVMHAFQQGKLQVLVATTVIEVGVDVPNASLMVIENAERLGLAQLHQLRGRVGRGAVASHCILLYQHPLSDIAKERLTVMRETTNGFKIAERDLALRGPGDILGTRQTGELSFRVADLLRDRDLLPAIQQTADLLMRDHPDTVPLLIKRWLGRRDEYGKI